MRTPELLAPAGGPDALRAAVANGADAVYLGLSELNARRGAENFTLETLGEATRFAHLRGARVYLTANVLVLADEMERALAMIGAAWAAGVDAVIIQDLGLMAQVRRLLPDVRIHASTQVDAHNAESVEALAGLGASRVTLARELSTSEIEGLVRGATVELESFVHGSLCFCHSGQCLMSSMIGGRSANRGLCAQPCRLPYELVGADGTAADVPGRFLLSPKDLAGITVLPDLVRSGVAALKIEGRMKSPEYVATVVRVYRAALDRAVADVDGFSVHEAEWDLLSEAFSRGFTEAYLSDIRGDDMMSYQRPNNRGVAVGRVTSTRPGAVTVALERAVESADTLEFWTGSGRFTQAAGPMRLGGGTVSAAPAGSTVELAVEGSVRPGDRVFRVANAALIEAARRTFSGEGAPVPAEVAVRLRIGEPASVTVRAAGVTGGAQGAAVEQARTRAVTADDVMEHVGRMGGSGYEPASWAVELDAGAGIGFSELHRLRREALESVDAQRLAPWAGRREDAPKLTPPAGRVQGRPVAPEVVVACSDAAVAKAAADSGADRVLLAITCADAPAAMPPRTEPLLPRVAHPGEVGALLERAAGGRATAGNLGLLRAAGAAAGAPEGGVASDWGLNVVNPWTAEVFGGLGASLVWASPELAEEQLARLVASSPVAVGALVHGRVELMVAEHCVLQAAGACGHRCPGCARRREPFVLRDRKGYEFPVVTDAAGRSHIYNSVPLDLSRAMDRVVASGVSAVRLDLHLDTPRRAAELVRAYRALVADAVAGRPMPAEAIERPSTSGHFFRGLR